MTESAVSKSEFAAMCSVDPSRVSHWIREGKISGAAILGEGRAARIVPLLAREQLKNRLDTGQRFGNGLKTKLDTPRHTPAAVQPPKPTAPSYRTASGR